MRRITDPDYVYTPWSKERREAASIAARRRLAEKRAKPYVDLILFLINLLEAGTPDDIVEAVIILNRYLCRKLRAVESQAESPPQRFGGHKSETSR
jgi:hypothetical protein